ncbi:hypothetical protein MKX01_018974 [Papaver californicum]|nr:hypothetical protein MKX01_018974 [Papaver californicum]
MVIKSKSEQVLKTIGTMIYTKINEEPLYFKIGDVVEFNGEYCEVRKIKTSTIDLKRIKGMFKLENTGLNRALITNMSCEAPDPLGGVRTLLTFEILFKVKERHQAIREKIVKYMEDNVQLKDQKS